MQPSVPRPRASLSRRQSILLLGLLLAGAGLAYRRTRPSSPLPEGAYPVLSIASWAGQNSLSPGVTPYQWLANGDLVHLEIGPHARLQLCCQKVDARGPVGPMRRGLEVPSPPNMPPRFQTASFVSSPDEKRVACVWTSGPSLQKTVMVSTDGKTTRAIPEYFLQWLSDSRSFLALSPAPIPVLKVCHLASTHAEVIPRLTPMATILSVQGMTAGPEFLIGGRVSHLPPAPSENYPSMTLRSFRVSQPDVVQQTWQATVPRDVTFGMAFASSDNRHLLWYTGTQTPAGQKRFLGIEWLQNLFPTRETAAVVTQGWYLSDRTGKEMHGVFESSSGKIPNFPGCWTPDSKHLSFLYKQRLYLVPME